MCLKGDELNETATEGGDEQTVQQTAAGNTTANERNKFWNISNDEHYNPKNVVQEAAVATAAATSTKHVSTALTLQHTQAALELNAILFPTHLSNQKLKNFHRYPLKYFFAGSQNIESISTFVNSILRKFTPTLERPQFQLNFSSKSCPDKRVGKSGFKLYRF